MAEPYVFLSYAGTDRERVIDIAAGLRAVGVEIWMDKQSIAGGASWSAEIVRAIRECTALLLVSSPAAVASANVRQELQLAWDQGRPCLPLVLARTAYPDEVQYLLAGRHWIEILDRSEEEWLPEVLRALGRLGMPVGDAAAAGSREPGRPVQRQLASQTSRRLRRSRLFVSTITVLLIVGLLAIGVEVGRHRVRSRPLSASVSAGGQAAKPITPTLSVYAGTGEPGHMNAPRTLAQFSSPAGLNITPEGSDLIVVDAGNAILREITGGGMVYDFCGAGSPGYVDGPCATAQFSQPSLLARGPDGTVYVGDTGNLRIRAISSARAVSTLAGAGVRGFSDGESAAAQFAGVGGIDVDQRTGILYMADYGNNRVRRITPAGVVTTYAGTGAPGYVDGPATVAQFNAPRGVNIDAKGNVYVHDAGNHRIRKISPDGVVSTLAGSGDVGFADGMGAQAQFGGGTIATTTDFKSGNFYMMDAGNHRIRRITPEGVVSTVFEFTEPDQTPFNIRISPSGDAYVSDSAHNRIYKISGLISR